MAFTVATGNEIFNEADSPLLNGVVRGLVDFKGRPAVRSKSGCWKSVFYTIGAGVEMAERFSYYGISSNLVSYLTGPMGQSTVTAVVNVSVWSGMAALTPLLGAFVADAFFGRYKTIIVASFLYILGLSFLSLSAAGHSSNCNSAVNNGPCSPSAFHAIFFFSSLYLVALVQGGHRPCLQAFAADQFDDEDPEECKAKASFFNWWNFCLCASVLTSLFILNYVQENLSWELGFGIPAIVMIFALLVLSFGTKTYRFRVNSDERNPFVRIGSVFVKAFSSWDTPKALSIEEEDPETASLDKTPFKFLDKASFPSNGSQEFEKACKTNDIEDAKAILNLLPLWCTCLGLAIISAQPSTLFTKQGATMDRYIISSFQIPSASLQSLISIAVMLFLPVYDLVFVPMTRAITKNSSGITMLQRIGIGLFLSIISMIIAGFIEQKRLATAVEFGLVGVPEATVPMSVWWLVPQYVVLGLADCFGAIGLQELFYDQVPCELKSVGVALYLSVFGIGNFLNSFLVWVIEKATGGDGKESWFSDNLNGAHLDYFYWLLAGLCSVAFVSYLYFARSYDYYTRKANV